MIILLNGPLGIAKSTLAGALSESIESCVMLGDHLVAANPRPADEWTNLHSTIALLVEHHRRFDTGTLSSITSGTRQRSSAICVSASWRSIRTPTSAVSS